MAKYQVYVTAMVHDILEVNAETPEQARAIAANNFDLLRFECEDDLEVNRIVLVDK